MPGTEPEIVSCEACGNPMDVSAVGPFTNVECPSCGRHTRVKREFGPYILTRRHAIGGMSMVFVARDTTLDREVVVKILSEEFSADEKRIGAFEEEARTTASISHPHVVRVLTTGHAFGRFFIAMEFVPGGHFEHHIRERGTIPELDALPLAIQVAEGLKAAKAAGLIHRDVKPGNILLDASGSAKLVDFGLALVTKGGKAKAEEIWATPYYVPPETIEGHEEDFRSDIYAFGATFYHALAGVPPCSEETMDTRRLREAKQRVRPLQEVAPQVSAETCAVIDRCMAYAPDGRYRSYVDLISDLKLALQHRQTGALRQPAAEPPRSGRKRAREGAKWPVWLGVAAVIAALGMVAAWVFGGGESPAPAPPVEVGVAPPADGGAEVREPGGLVVAGLYREAAAALEAGDFERAASLYAQVRDHPEVLEPTASWAACEAIAATWMSGGSDRARREVGAALDHLKNSPRLAGGVRSTLVSGLEALSGFKPVRIGESAKDDAALLVVWISALRNWEQGMPEEAEKGFRRVVEAAKPGNKAWLKPHALWAGHYLEDLEKLRRIEPQDFNLEPEKAKALAVELEAIHGSLKTQGRARFNIRCWQLELLRAAVRKPVAPQETDNGSGEDVRSPDALPSGLMERIADCRFKDATELLSEWNPEGPEVREQRDGLIQLLQSASALLGDLGENAAGTQLTMLSRDEREFMTVKEGDARGLTLLAADGKEARLGWGEISPDSVIDLHRALARGGSPAQADSLRRHEQAIAFDLLVGNPERARAAGDRLAEASEPFRRRWKSLSGSVPR